ncbi:MAG: 1-deoxy-D-xylulose-5-phosphate reductoisomerase [Candidatus Omnitrophota bacterium]
MTSIVLLGSTGSIGQNALEVVRRFPDKFRVTGLSTHSNVDLLSRQISEFHPEFVCVKDALVAQSLGRRKKAGLKILIGEKGLSELIEKSKAKKVLLAISGSGALLPLLKAIDEGKQIALANKEAMVMAGALVMKKAKEKKVEIIPIDSEQSAIWQCLAKDKSSPLKTIYLTASGGPFRQVSQKALKDISVREVLNHPRWKMGKKITVDSATLMNKGLELLEAMFLFDMPCEKIKIVVHPQAIVHSMVEFLDGVILAQLSATDMRIPIQYALTHPLRLSSGFPRVDFFKLRELSFYKPDFKKFPCLGLAYRAARTLGTLPAVLNAANEVCVDAFLRQRIKFISIPQIIEKVMDRHRSTRNPDLGEILHADQWARLEADRVIENMN